MNRNSNNRKRAFAEVVTVDAWHRPFSKKLGKVDLHADVVFGTARVGSEEQSQVRFRLAIKRAEIVVIVPPTEPVKIDKFSVCRDSPEMKGRLTQTTEKTKSLKRGITGKAELNKGLRLGALLEGSGESKATTKSKIEIAAPFRLFSVTLSRTAEGDYRWKVESETEGPLNGRPWHPTKQPRLKLVDERADRDKGLAPVVRVEVRCKREDLVIDDIELKDKKLWNKLKQLAGFRNKMAAAESYIRDRLALEGLDVGDLKDKFGHLTLAHAEAEPT